MGVARHQKRRKGKRRLDKPQKQSYRTAKLPSYITDAELFKLSAKTCELAVNNAHPDKIVRLYKRNFLMPDQYLMVIEHAEMRLDETITALYDDDPKTKVKYQASIDFLYKTRKHIADCFGLDETPNIFGTHSYEEMLNRND